MALEMLQMYDNQLENFPTMGNHPELKEIDLNSNRIEALDAALFEGMPALESFQLAKNQLKELPSTIFKCSALNFLNLSDNPLTAVPEEIKDCAELQVLFWANTKTTALPATMEALDNLLRVDLERNELDETSKELCSKMQSVVANKDGFFKF